jgi:hypothetical protein
VEEDRFPDDAPVPFAEPEGFIGDDAQKVLENDADKAETNPTDQP